MKSFRTVVLFAGTVTTLVGLDGYARAQCPAIPPPAPADADANAAVTMVMDRSGSMSSQISNCPGHLGETMYKWQCAVHNALKWIEDNDSLVVNGTRGTYKYWFRQLRRFYSGTGGVQEIDPAPYSYCGIKKRLEEFSGPTYDDANTPLAEVVCDAIDDIKGSPLTPRYLRLYTDGLENSSTTTHKCWGPHSPTLYVGQLDGSVALTYNELDPTVVATANQLRVPSWEANMLAMGVSGKLALVSQPPAFYTATEPGAYIPSGQNIIVSTDFYDYVPSSLVSPMVQSATTGGPDLPPVDVPARASSLAAASSSPYEPYAQFLQGLSQVTGGRMMRYLAEDAGGSGAPSSPHIIPGDVNDSGCVDDADRAALLGVFGQKITLTNLVTYQADVTYDGLVDTRDYNVMLANWGLGCVTPPSPPALPMEVLFGFEDASKWSSRQTVLYNKMSPVTGGTFALGVDGRGWRGVRTGPFSTSILHGVTGRIAYDVYVPTEQSNRFFHGATTLLVTCPSAGLFDFPVGVALFSRKSVGTYTTVEFALPRYIRSVMQTAHEDLSINIVIDAIDPGYLLDSLRFVP